MSICRTTQCVIFTVGVLLPLWSLARGEDEPAPHVFQLVRDLGHDSFWIREKAHRKLATMGPEALPALSQALTSSDLEVRRRVRQLIGSLRTENFYTISEEGRLFRLTVGQRTFHCQEVAKLGEPFEDSDVCVEGLAMCGQGMLYAAVVFRRSDSEQSVLYRVDPTSGAAKEIGMILPAEVSGLDFGPNGRLYGVLASCRHSALTGETQLIEIDVHTAKASATRSEIAHRRLGALAIGQNGQAILSHASCGLFQVDLMPHSTPEPFLCTEYFYTQMGSVQFQGLCYGQGSVLFAMSHPCRGSDNSLVRLDPKTGLIQCLGGLTFRARNLAVARGAQSQPLPAVAERTGS